MVPALLLTAPGVLQTWLALLMPNKMVSQQKRFNWKFS